MLLAAVYCFTLPDLHAFDPYIGCSLLRFVYRHPEQLFAEGQVDRLRRL